MEIDIEKIKGVLFVNIYKEHNSNKPDYKGFISHKETNQKILDVAAWNSLSKDGTKEYLSLKFSTPKEFTESKPKTETTHYAPSNFVKADEFNDDIPF